MEKKDNKPLMRWALSHENFRILEIYRECFGCEPPTDLITKTMGKNYIRAVKVFDYDHGKRPEAITAFIVYDYNGRKYTIITIGTVQKSATKDGKKILAEFINRARRNQKELAIAPGAVPESLCFLLRFLLPKDKLTPTEPAGTFLLTL